MEQPAATTPVPIFSMEKWKGRVALVTGASQGIGAAICKELAKCGMQVIGCARHIEGIQQLSDEITTAEYSGTITPIKCDLSNEADIDAMHERIAKDFKRLDVCVNNAMSCINSPLLSGNQADWWYMLEVNVLGLCLNTKRAIELLKRQDDSLIIHMGSMDGHRIPPLRKLGGDAELPWFNIYFGSKFMTRALAEGLRQEIDESSDAEASGSKTPMNKIRVSTISPGPVKTDSLARSTSEMEADRFFNRYSVLDKEDVVRAVKYILSTPAHVNVNDIILAPVKYNV